MKKLPTFFFGLIVGCIVMFIGLKYHIVRSQEGLHMVPKTVAKLTIPLVDIRSFSFEDWDAHRDLAFDIAQSDKSHLLEDAAMSSLDNAVRDVFDGFGTGTQGGR